MSTLSFTPTQRFWRLLQPDRAEIRNVYIYAVFNGMVGLSLPLGIQAIINLIQGGQISTAWIILVLIVVLGVAITGILQIMQLRITENLQQRIFTRAAFEFAYRLPRIKMEALYKHYAPELMNRFFDTLSVQKGLSKILLDFSTAALQLIFGLILLSLYHPFFIFFSVLLVLLVYAIFRFTAEKGLVTSLMESKFKYQVAHWLEELARTVSTFKLAGRTDMHLKRTDEHVKKYLKSRESHFNILVRQFSLLVLFKVVVATGLLAIGGILVIQQRMNIGQFVAAEIIILLVMASVEKLILSMETIYDVLTGLEKIGQVTDLELERIDGVDLVNVGSEEGLGVELQDIFFRYPGQNKDVLNGLDLEIKPGEIITVTGPSGSGKSTLLQILAGLYDVQQGHISYNGFPKGNLDLSSLRSIIGDYLAQEQLFEGTVFENISIGREDADFANVQWAIRNMGLEDFVKTLPRGYESVLDPQGNKLPGGIIQKLLLARSIADKPRLLLLEDAFKRLDEGSRRQIISFLTARKNPWTLVAISPDPYLEERSDKIITLENGRVKNVRFNQNINL